MAIFIPPKGTTAELSGIALIDGELVYNTTESQFYTGDNGKLGGKPVFTNATTPEGDFATKSDLNSLSATLTEQIAAAVSPEADPVFNAALTGLATKAELAEHEAYAESSYVKAAELDSVVSTAIDEATSGFATKALLVESLNELNTNIASNYVESADLEPQTTEIFGELIKDYYTKTAADEAIERAVSGLVKESDIASLISEEKDPDFHDAVSSLARLDDLINFATTGEVDAKIRETDYTSFEVNVISAAIPAGTASEIENPYISGEYIAYKYGVPASYANKIEKFYLCTDTPIEKSDVVIDWGDNTQTALSANGADVDVQRSKPGASYNKILVSHAYTEAKKYIVKIYGKDYFGIRNTDNDYNLISRVFEEDLSLASCVTDLTDFCHRARLLLKVDGARWINTKNVVVAYEMFGACHNLYYATGFYGFFPKLLRYNMMFSHCWSLVYTDIRIMPGTYAIHSMFSACHLLGSLPNKPVKVEDLFCENASFNARCAVTAAFRNCYSLKLNDASKVADLLWDNVNTAFVIGTSATRPFYCDNGVPAELADYAPSLTASFTPPAWLSAVPTTWGGSKTDDTIIVNKQFFNNLLARLAAVEAAVSGANRTEND